MTSRHVIPQVLQGFLGTFTSRNSDCDGWWVFGFLVEGLGKMSIDLLGGVAEGAEGTPEVFVRRLAAQRFSEQLAKSGLSRQCVREARVDIWLSSERTFGWQNHTYSSGYDMSFQAHAVSDLGKSCDSPIWTVFVAPHDPKLESRSLRAAQD